MKSIAQARLGAGFGYAPVIDDGMSAASDGMLGSSLDVRRKKARERRDYRLIYGICLMLIFPAAVVAQCHPQRWRQRRSEARRLSIWAASSEEAHRCTSIAFQG